jgi:3',5'-cyclic AMP phosphodiesterase CpdA
MSVLMMQVSDPHFGVERSAVCTALRRLAHEQKPALVAASGDITQRARGEQFAAARCFLDSLGAPALMVLPGNHDIPLFNVAARVFAPYRAYRRAFGKAHDTMIDTPHMRVVGLDSTRRYRHINGELSTAQIERTARLLRDAPPGVLRAVVLHHPVVASRASERHNRVHNHAAAVHRWVESGADLVFGGHIHLPFVHALRGDGNRTGWAVQAGTSVSLRTRRDAGNSVNLIRIDARDPRQCVVERWDYREHSGQFELIALSALTLDPHPD